MNVLMKLIFHRYADDTLLKLPKLESLIRENHTY